MKILLLSICTMLLSMCAHAQELPTIVPPSPSAYELTKYGDIPINESTGMASISIPLLNYGVGKLSSSVSLSYTTSGIKVDQVASWVGMGWNLNAGGVITRTVRGSADEQYQKMYGQSFDDLRSLYVQDHIEYYKFMTKAALSNDRDEDYEPDLYSFNVGAISGTFILNKNSIPVMLDKKNQYKIQINNTEGGFEIIDNEGNKYLFNTYEYNTVRTICGSGGVPLEAVMSAVYLSKITALNGDEIYFNYINDNYAYVSGYNSSFTKNIVPYIEEGTCMSLIPPSPGYRECTLRSDLQSKKLYSITNNRNYNKIQFTASTGRDDLSPNALKLEEITLLDQNKVVKEYKLNYSMVESIHQTSNSILNSDEYKKRLFLDEVVEVSSEDNLIEGKKHSFVYDAPNNLPPRYSFAQDLLGFYNGENANPSLLPKQDDPYKQLSNYAYGNRTSNFLFASKGILKKVNYPTGGCTSLEYEPSAEILTDFSFNYKTFGLSTVTNESKIRRLQFESLFDQPIEIKSIVEILDGQDVVHDRMLYTLKDVTSNEIVFDANVEVGTRYSSEILLERGRSGEIVLKKDHLYEVEIDLTLVKFDLVKGAVRFDYIESEKENSFENKSGIRIKRVISEESNTSPKEIKRYYYNRLENYNEEPVLKFNKFELSSLSTDYAYCNPGPNDPDVYADYPVFKVSSGGWNAIYELTNQLNMFDNVTVSYGGDNFENGATEKQFLKIQSSKNYNFESQNIPNATVSNESQFNGTLLRERFYKNGETQLQKVKETIFDYKIDNDKTTYISGYIGYNRSPGYQITGPDILTDLEIRRNTRYLSLNHYYVYSRFNKLISKTVIDYYDNNTSLTTSEKYFYNNVNPYLISGIETVNSNGYNVKTKLYYPDDKSQMSGLTVEASASIEKLKIQNRIATPVQTETYNNDVLLATQRTNYKDWGNSIILPESVQTLKGTLSILNPLEDRIVYHSYDTKGNPTEVSKKDGAHIVYIWGYNDTHPIAKLEGVTLNDIPQQSINNIKNASNLDDDRTVDIINTDGSISYVDAEGLLRQNLNSLRNVTALKDVQITTYTYDPLIGVTSITDPRGQVIYYEYDDFNRLKFIKDQDRNILKENQYNYKN